ncbi:NADPH-dependent FMN reductase [Flexibacterium corallicola]|uniref:NADPH-dependent FMN reductase n=1 Tax=Flexibacterium corallicola TaxID=3037259 RepID=UPI00286F3179|nr:NADPH-dependent FMN reductase [Pseudovibrio sp. M1P-2-3]
MNPSILVLSGSVRSGSVNTQLASLVSRHLSLENAHVTQVSLRDYPLPIYDGDLEEEHGIPENAHKLRVLLEKHQGIFVASPEYNSSVTPLLKNTLDWISRIIKTGEEPLEVFSKGVYALGGASPGVYGGMRSLMHLRVIMEVSLGATVIPEMISVNFAGKAFNENGELAKEFAQKRLTKMVERLVRESGYVKMENS